MKNRIIPQMFDVRPVDQTGDLDWKKIQSIGNDKAKSEKLNHEHDVESKSVQSEPSGLNAYILGVPVESKSAPIFHESEFNVKNIVNDGDFAGKSLKDLEKASALLHSQILNEKKRLECEKKQHKLTQLEKQKNLFEQQELARKKREEQLRLENFQREMAVKKEKAEAELQRKNSMAAEEKRVQQLENSRLERLKLERELRQNAIIEEKKRQDQQREILLDEEKKRLERQQQAVLEKINILHKEKEAQIVAEKIRQQNQRDEFVVSEAERSQQKLQRIAMQNRLQHEEYEATVLSERENRQRMQAEWLENELRDQVRREKQLASLAKKSTKTKKKSLFKNKSYRASHDRDSFLWRNIFSPPTLAFQFDVNKSFVGFAFVAAFVLLSLGGVAFASKGFGLKGRVLGVSTSGYDNLNSAVSDIAHQNFEGSSEQFTQAYANFSKASVDLDGMGATLIDATRFVPFASKLASGKNAVEAGKHFSAAGKALNEVAKMSAELKNPIDSENGSDTSLLDILAVAQKNITDAKKEMDLAQQNIDHIAVDDLPADKRDKFILLKQQLPDLRSGLDYFLNNSHILADLLGGNGPRKYLFLFQNNSEMRATGGFIGSYGLLDIANGHVKKFFIDGIFNPDGQLREKIVPPAPIQKISASWSMHDSNWFPDFPTSAKKAIQFYEKTGGPTADGVITFTPTVMQKLLEITGPIELPEYNVTLDSKNFIELTQFKVEVDYDKEDNKPKKILSDLAPLVMEKLLSSKDLDTISKTASALLEGLREKHILFYSENSELEKIISAQGWSGEMLPSSKDYISVINSNINGFKTDAVIDEHIDHKAEIQSDGSIIDTVSITRKHDGGNSEYEWLNKVNADYMRVYVPQGSKLLEVTGQTRETDTPPLDYDALGFKRDTEVQNQESGIKLDPESGTQIYSENGKTVFANWAYVSPQESMTITYKYLLPFAMFKVAVGDSQQIDSYSLVAQKQSGSVGSSYDWHISYPANYVTKWNFPAQSQINSNGFDSDTDLKTDRFEAVVFEKQKN